MPKLARAIRIHRRKQNRSSQGIQINLTPQTNNSSDNGSDNGSVNNDNSMGSDKNANNDNRDTVTTNDEVNNHDNCTFTDVCTWLLLSTMMSPPNFKTSYFQHPVLNSVVGELNYNFLLSLFQQVKVNASSVPCTLGGGSDGHLGLVVSVAEYVCIVPNTPYFRETRPADFPLLALRLKLLGKS